MFTTRFEAWVRRRAEALMSAIGRVPLTPNQVTVVGMVLMTALFALTVAISLNPHSGIQPLGANELLVRGCMPVSWVDARNIIGLDFVLPAFTRHDQAPPMPSR